MLFSKAYLYTNSKVGHPSTTPLDSFKISSTFSPCPTFIPNDLFLLNDPKPNNIRCYNLLA